MVAEPAAVPRNDWKAALSESLEPGIVVWYVSTSGSWSMIASASMARSSVASAVVPGGGVIETWMTSSEPAFRNAVGMPDAAPIETTKSRAAMPSVTHRKRRAPCKRGV